MARDIPVTMNMVATARGPGRESPCSMGRQAVPTNIPPLWMIRTKLQIKLPLVLNFHLYLEIYSNSQSFRKMWFASPHRKFYFGNSLGWNIWILQCTRHLKMNVQVIIIIFFILCENAFIEILETELRLSRAMHAKVMLRTVSFPVPWCYSFLQTGTSVRPGSSALE